jgi:rfaE bifunctional protein nucleotidyltransferase chain/domain
MSVRRATDRILPIEKLLTILGPLRERGQRVVFTNGCFDLVHAGHAALLEEAAALGDLLVVGLNSDESVRRLKGPARPLMPESQRARLLATLRPVDYVVLFREDTPRKLIEMLLPDLLVKGADYEPGEIVGREAVEAHGGRVVRLPLVAGLSTSGILRRLQEGPNPPS